jgi:hypothetical protein
MDRRRFFLTGAQVLAAGSIWTILGRNGGPQEWPIPGLDEARAAGGTEGARGAVAEIGRASCRERVLAMV